MTDQPRIAVADQVRFELSWTVDDEGGLDGELRARNVGDVPVRLTGMPLVEPLGVHGERLDTEFVVTLEMRIPPWVDLAPGDEAVAPVGWSAWDGPPASGEVDVSWDGGGRVRVAVTGPVQPTATGPGNSMSSSWFSRVS